MILFHGTTSKFKTQIMRHGLRPRDLSGKSVYADMVVNGKTLESHPGLIYLTDTYAAQFARLATDTYGGGYMVVSVNVNEADLLPDTDFEHQQTGIQCLGYSGTCCIRSERLQPLAIYMLDKRQTDKFFPDVQIWTGIGHLGMGVGTREHMDYLLMCAKNKWVWDRDEWVDKNHF